MWILFQKNKDGNKIRFIVSDDYDKLYNYIKKFSRVKRYSENHFEADGGEIIFDIYLSTKL